MTLYVACITVRRDQESAETSRLLCVARKLSDVSPHPLTVVTSSAVMQAAAAASSAAQAAAAAAQANSAIIANATELFTTKLDPTSFKVMKVMHTDTSPSAGGTTSRSVYKTFGIGLAHIADNYSHGIDLAS